MAIDKIKYISPQEFRNLVDLHKMREVGVFPNYHFGNKVTSAKPMFSRYANTCSIICFNDTMLHHAPEYRQPDFMKKLSELIKKEKDEKGHVSAFVIGGKEGDRASEALFYDSGDVFEMEGADLTMFGLKKSTPERALASVGKYEDTVVFTYENNPELERLVRTNPNPSQSSFLDIIKQFLSHIEISPNHKLLNGE